MIDEKLELRAESMGSMCREVGDPRDRNPYLEHLDVSPAIARELAEAWWRGWDRADAALKPKGK